MKNFLQIVFLAALVAGIASAEDVVAAVPEVGAGGIASAVGLLAGGLLVMRARRKK